VQLSWCKIEGIVRNQKSIRVFGESEEGAPKEVPPLAIMSLSIRTVFENNVNEIVSASALVYNQGNYFF
jgi:DNA polymerase alpha subunit A